MRREDLGWGRVELGAPLHRPAKDGLHAHSEAAVACEHLAIGERHVGVLEERLREGHHPTADSAIT